MVDASEMYDEMERLTNERRAIRKLYLRLDPLGPTHERGEYDDLS